jgi:hypothetical protein
MDELTLFGFLSVAVMLMAYILERRGDIWILIFALGCLSSAVYGYFAGTLPFAIVEIIWAVAAIWRWRNQKRRKHHDVTDVP